MEIEFVMFQMEITQGTTGHKPSLDIASSFTTSLANYRILFIWEQLSYAILFVFLIGVECLADFYSFEVFTFAS